MDALFALAKRHGEPCTIYFEGQAAGVPVAAFIEPIMDRRGSAHWTSMTPLGEKNSARWLYLGPPEPALDGFAGAYLVCGERSFVFLRAEKFCLRGRVTHWEAVLAAREEDPE